MTALHLAALEGMPNTLSELVRQKADINAKDQVRMDKY